MFLLPFGLDFTLPVYNIDLHKYFLSFEKLVCSLKNNKLPMLPEFNDQLQSLADKYYYNFSPYKVISTIFSAHDLRFLRDFGRNSNIVVCKPDKGNSIFVVDKDRYVESTIIIYQDFLSTPKRGSHVKSDKTHTQSSRYTP